MTSGVPRTIAPRSSLNARDANFVNTSAWPCMSNTRSVFMPDSGEFTKSMFPSIVTRNAGTPDAPRKAIVIEELDSSDELDSGKELFEDCGSELFEDSGSELLEDSGSELLDNSRAELLDGTSAELDSGSELLEDSEAELLDGGGTNSHSLTTTPSFTAKHTLKSFSTILNSPSSTAEPSHADTGESSVTFWLPGNGSSFILAPLPLVV